MEESDKKKRIFESLVKKAKRRKGTLTDVDENKKESDEGASTSNDKKTERFTVIGRISSSSVSKVCNIFPSV